METMNRLFWLYKRGLSRQLLTGFSISLATIGLATLWGNHRLIQSDLQAQVEERAQSITQALEFSTEGLLDDENASILRRVVQNYSTLPAVVEIAIVNHEGITLAHSSQDLINRPYKALHPELTQAMEKAANTGVESSHSMEIDGKPVLAEVLPFSSILFGTSGRRGLAIVIVDLKQMQHKASQTFLTSTLIMLAGSVVILLIMGVLIRRYVLQPLNALNESVKVSKKTGAFSMPPALPANEIQFLATTFEAVFQQLDAYGQLQAEMTQRRQAEKVLRESEVRERAKSQELEKALQELKATQSQLIQSEKMSSLGQLVAGVAHEINNPVNFIHGNLQHTNRYSQDLLELLELYQMQYPNSLPVIQDKIEEIDLEFLQEDFPKLLASMKVGAERIREIVKSLRAFSRLDEAEVKDVDIHEGIDSTLMILQNRLKARPKHPAIQVVKHYGDLPKVECYAGQLNQVFMNILSNAIDALDERDENRSLDEITAHPSVITICTEPVGVDRVAIRIADNGAGMSEKTQQRLFDPFFTTKAVGKGTGLGLSISHQIVTEKHNGSLHCVSVPGEGTEFIVDIPTRQSKPYQQDPQAELASVVPG
jgi:two-component system NtrC family sensor kinase